MRTLNCYCHMSKSANRRTSTHASCPFRAIIKLDAKVILQAGRDETKISWEKAVKVTKLNWVHNHPMINFESGEVESYASQDHGFNHMVSQKVLEELGRCCQVEVDPQGGPT